VLSDGADFTDQLKACYHAELVNYCYTVNTTTVWATTPILLMHYVSEKVHPFHFRKICSAPFVFLIGRFFIVEDCLKSCLVADDVLL